MRRFTIPLLAVLAILLTAGSCTLLPNPNPTLDCHAGTKGLVASFVGSSDLSSVQQQEPTPVVIQVNNAGASTTAPKVRLTYNQDFFNATNPQLPGIQQNWTSIGKVQGAASWNKCQGSQQRESYTLTAYPLPLGSASFDQTLYVDLCYQYWTNLSTNVCVSPAQTQQNALQPACTPSDTSFTGGQGGPFGITKVTAPVVFNQTTKDGTKRTMVRIGVYARNYGNGDIVAPLDAGNSTANKQRAFNEACSLSAKSFKNYAYVKAILGDETLDCNVLPGPSGPAPAQKIFLRYDPTTIQANNGGSPQVLRDYYFECQGPYTLSAQQAISLPFDVEIAYYYRDIGAATQAVTVRKV